MTKEKNILSSSNLNFPSGFRGLKKHFDTLVASVAGFCIIMAFSRYGGIGISPDSIAYASVARNLVAGNGFTIFTGETLVLFPLFFPLFLGIVMWVSHTDIVAVAPVLNATLFAIVIFICGVLIEHFRYKTQWYKRILLLMITVSPSLIEIYSMLWSETLFILLALVFMWQFRRYFVNHSILNLIGAGVVTALAFDTRYAGITVVATGCLLIVFDPELSLPKRWLHIGVFGSTGVSVAAFNLLRNAWISKNAMGMRQASITPFQKNVEISGTVFSDWFNLQLKGGLAFELFAAAILLFFLIFFVKNILHRKAYHTIENIAVAFFIVYVLFIIVSSTISRYETINNRLLAPAFIPLWWISTCQLPKWIGHLNSRHLKRIATGIVIGVAILVAGGYMAINADNFSYMNESGIPGYSDDTWKKSDLVVYLQAHPELFDEDGEVYSNFSQAVYFLTGKAVEPLPERVYTEDVEEFRECDATLIIWFDMDKNTDVLNEHEVRKLKHITGSRKFRDGKLLFVEN